jgi:hypothetical protein
MHTLINEPYIFDEKRNPTEAILPMKDDKRMLSVLEEFRVQNKSIRVSLLDANDHKLK